MAAGVTRDRRQAGQTGHDGVEQVLHGAQVDVRAELPPFCRGRDEPVEEDVVAPPQRPQHLLELGMALGVARHTDDERRQRRVGPVQPRRRVEHGGVLGDERVVVDDGLLELAEDAVEHRLVDRCVELRLGGEVVVDRRAGEAARLGDRAVRGRLVAITGEQLDGGLEDPRPGLGGIMVPGATTGTRRGRDPIPPACRPCPDTTQPVGRLDGAEGARVSPADPVRCARRPPADARPWRRAASGRVPGPR